jgi:hypothetical protein
MIEVIYLTLEILSWVSISTVLIFLLSLWALWILYIAMMNVKRALMQGDIPWQAKLLVVPTRAIFDVIEFFCNVVVCTVVFLDLPKEITVSDRLRRYHRNNLCPKWRMVIVDFIKPMIDPFDPEGTHIK